MVDLHDVSGWIERYVAAWNSNEPDEIADLFTEDAEYWTDPFGQPWTGRDEIVKEWLGHRDKPGETSFEWSPVVVTEGVAVIQGETRYPQVTYSNLWMIKLDRSGRCGHFTEWWMAQPGPQVSATE
jgi:hypothetical protein